jgi:hypothetical protein
MAILKSMDYKGREGLITYWVMATCQYIKEINKTYVLMIPYLSKSERDINEIGNRINDNGIRQDIYLDGVVNYGEDAYKQVMATDFFADSEPVIEESDEKYESLMSYYRGLGKLKPKL